MTRAEQLAILALHVAEISGYVLLLWVAYSVVFTDRFSR